MNWLYATWWKVLGVIIYLYVLIGGMTVPLSSGITDVSHNGKITYGSDIVLVCTGYNTRFTQGENHAWLKVGDDHFLAATSIEVLNDNTISTKFSIPSEPISESNYILPTLILYNETFGRAIQPEAISILKDEINPGSNNNQWQSGFGMDLTQPSGIRFPYRNILVETIRNTFFHVALWMAMTFLFFLGLVYAIQYYRKRDLMYDRLSASCIKAGIIFGILGTVTGSIWARYTWGTFWTTDVKLNMAMISMLIYLAYLVLRSSSVDFDKRARFSSAYSIFAFCAMVPLLFVIPRMTDSLHPGNGGNPALGGEDLDNTLRMFFYPAIIAMILIGLWLASIMYRTDEIEEKIMKKNQV